LPAHCQFSSTWISIVWVEEVEVTMMMMLYFRLLYYPLGDISLVIQVGSIVSLIMSYYLDVVPYVRSFARYLTPSP
jgi:hypothetical protein